MPSPDTTNGVLSIWWLPNRDSRHTAKARLHVGRVALTGVLPT
ncbi:MAG: hypothetical protein AAFR81_26335 [Chloroflexota bacterium]